MGGVNLTTVTLGSHYFVNLRLRGLILRAHAIFPRTYRHFCRVRKRYTEIKLSKN